MIKYRGPRIKIIRRLGLLPGLTSKVSKKNTTPGQHGKLLYTKRKRAALSDDYKQRLLEKQKVRFNYGLNEKQLLSYYKKAKKKKGSTTGTFLFQLLESRLDCLVYRFGFAPTILAARQLINHRHILVNEKIITIPSFICNLNDFISIKKSEKSKNLVSKFLENIEQKRKSIIRRSKTILTHKLEQVSRGKKNIRKLAKLATLLPIKNLLPEHLFLDPVELKGQYILPVKKTNIIVRINDLKLIEYYSR
jgi:small subunit ribosomal protein S4